MSLSNFKKSGVVVLLCVFLLISMPAVPSWSADSGNSKAAEKVEPPVGALIRLSGQVLESPPGFALLGRYPQMTLEDWLRRLAKARNDPKVKLVAIEIDSPMMNWSQAEEFADAISRLSKEKPVYAYITSGSAMEYIVASSANHLTMEPTGMLEVVGLGAELMFFRGTLDWLGIEPQMVQIGRFKGAAEPLTQKGPTDEMKAMYGWVLDDLYSQLKTRIQQQRRLSPDEVAKAIDSAPLSGEEAKSFKLVDELMPRNQWLAEVRKNASPQLKNFRWVENYGRKGFDDLDFSNPLALLGKILNTQRKADQIKDPTIAIIHAEGVITSGISGETAFGQRIAGARTLVKCFRDVENDDRIKAVVFRINSPGGSALASELIYQEVSRCNRRKPVIVSISDVGASGGYYIAAGGGTIIADPSALVGSIGVISGKMAITGLLNKLGISTYEITRGQNAGLEMSRAWDPREQEIIRKSAQRTYDVFVNRVRQSRGTKIKNIEETAQGRIFTGKGAMEHGLVDSLGGLRDAILAAQTAANIKEATFITLPAPKTLIELLSEDEEDASFASPAMLAAMAMPSPQALNAQMPGIANHAAVGYFLNLADMMNRETTLTVVPYYLSIRR